MNHLTFAVALCAVFALPAAAQDARVDLILDRLANANAHRDHVMVIAHRGSWWNEGEIVEAENSIASIDRSVVVDDRDVRDIEGLRLTYDAFDPEAIEVLNRWNAGDPLTPDGGLNFSTEARALAIANDTHLWVNTLFQGARANLAGGRGDPLAVGPGATDDGWGFWVRAGATMIQTDEPKALIAYLDSIGARKPYD